MTDAEFAIEKYLARAANRAWQVGRLNAHTQIIRSINCLRRHAPPTLLDHRDDDEWLSISSPGQKAALSCDKLTRSAIEALENCP